MKKKVVIVIVVDLFPTKNNIDYQWCMWQKPLSFDTPITIII